MSLQQLFGKAVARGLGGFYFGTKIEDKNGDKRDTGVQMLAEEIMRVANSRAPIEVSSPIKFTNSMGTSPVIEIADNGSGGGVQIRGKDFITSFNAGSILNTYTDPTGKIQTGYLNLSAITAMTGAQAGLVGLLGLLAGGKIGDHLPGEDEDKGAQQSTRNAIQDAHIAAQQKINASVQNHGSMDGQNTKTKMIQKTDGGWANIPGDIGILPLFPIAPFDPSIGGTGRVGVIDSGGSVVPGPDVVNIPADPDAPAGDQPGTPGEPGPPIIGIIGPPNGPGGGTIIMPPLPGGGGFPGGATGSITFVDDIAGINVSTGTPTVTIDGCSVSVEITVTATADYTTDTLNYSNGLITGTGTP